MGFLDGRVAIVTGAAGGIGASISRMFAAEGAKLVLNDLGSSEDGTGGSIGPAIVDGEDIAQKVETAGPKAHGLHPSRFIAPVPG